jgi:hypothetical protein
LERQTFFILPELVLKCYLNHPAILVPVGWTLLEHPFAGLECIVLLYVSEFMDDRSIDPKVRSGSDPGCDSLVGRREALNMYMQKAFGTGPPGRESRLRPRPNGR